MVTDMISSFLLYTIVALASIQNSHGFTPLASSGQRKTIGRRLSESRSPLFDTEEASPWTTQEWTAPDISASLNKMENPLLTNSQNDIGGIDFLPSESDMQVAEKALATANIPSHKSISGIENEFPNKKKITASVTETGTDSMKSYMKTMCNHELLNKNEEIILAREIQILLKWEAQREELELQLLR